MRLDDIIGFIVLLVIGYTPLWFAYTARRRWVRVVLALIAAFCLWMSAGIFVLGGSADSLQGSSIPILMLILGAICGLSALGALVLAFIPAKPRATTPSL